LHLTVRCHSASFNRMAAYSIDLRQKIGSAYARRLGSQRAPVDVFGVKRSSVEKVLLRYRTTGELGPKPQGGRPATTWGRGRPGCYPTGGAQSSRCHSGRTLGLVGRPCRRARQSRDEVSGGAALGLPLQKNRPRRRSAPRRASSRRGHTVTGYWLGGMRGACSSWTNQAFISPCLACMAVPRATSGSSAAYPKPTGSMSPGWAHAAPKASRPS
jgi:hypothetical protein